MLRAGLVWCADCTHAALARNLAHELAMVELELAYRLKAAAVDLSLAADWSADRSSHAELIRRRYPPDGDPERWVRGEVA